MRTAKKILRKLPILYKICPFPRLFLNGLQTSKKAKYCAVKYQRIQNNQRRPVPTFGGAFIKIFMSTFNTIMGRKIFVWKYLDCGKLHGNASVQIIRKFPVVLKFVEVKYSRMGLFMKIFWSLPCSAIIRKFSISWKYSSCLVGNNQDIANPPNIQRTFFSVAGMWSMTKLGILLALPLFLGRGLFSKQIEIKKR